jgi:ABC-type nickel/cobalt efflux system permease component RcnA
LFGLDQMIAGLSGGASLVLVLAVALLLGLRHASDPDHLVAVSTLVAGERERAARRATRLGAAWGLGHATTLTAFGAPIVFFGAYLPDVLQRAAEALVGVVIVLLAVRLLRRWRRGAFHAHTHAHGELVHRHLHGHAAAHAHEHPHVTVRSPAQAYAIGLVHGVGGSGGLGVLLLASIPGRTEALAALLVFAFAAAVSMATLSSALGFALGRAPVERRMLRLAPALGVLSLVFGCWYAVAAAVA